FELESDSEGPGGPTGASPLQEGEVMELAADLLGASNEAEVTQTLVNAVSSGAEAVNRPVQPPTGQALVAAIKPVAKAALPVAGAPGAGKAAGRELGLELEGLSQEDAEFEVAKQVVRLASTAGAIASDAPPHVPPAEAAHTALVEAAKAHAPGIVPSL